MKSSACRLLLLLFPLLLFLLLLLLLLIIVVIIIIVVVDDVFVAPLSSMRKLHISSEETAKPRNWPANKKAFFALLNGKNVFLWAKRTQGVAFLAS